MSWDDLESELAEMFGDVRRERHDDGAHVVQLDRREYLREAYRTRWKLDRKFRTDRKLYFAMRRLLATKPLRVEEGERHLWRPRARTARRGRPISARAS